MPKLKCESQSPRSPQDAYERVKKLLENDGELKKLDASYKCSFDDAKLSGSAKGSKFDAVLSIAPSGTGSKVEIEVSLPLMLSPFKGLVQSTLQKKMDAALA